jgi:hypothetical protein
MDPRSSRKLKQYQSIFSHVGAAATARAASSGQTLGLAASLATAVVPPRHWFTRA